MCFACETETRCDHPLSECVAVEGVYCVGCRHVSIRPPQPPQQRMEQTVRARGAL
jgi:hypothetical protein